MAIILADVLVIPPDLISRPRAILVALDEYTTSKAKSDRRAGPAKWSSTPSAEY